jgi:hypothetical protein
MARLEAPDPYSLSALIAGELEDVLVDRGAPAPARALLALGESTDPSRAWPDALSASALAAHTRTPILLTRADALPTPVRDLLAAQRPGLVQVVGGSAAIPDPVASAAASAARGSWRRLWGLTRYGTSVAVAQSAVAAGLTARTVWLATGLNYPDALAAGPAAGGSAPRSCWSTAPGSAARPSPSSGWRPRRHGSTARSWSGALGRSATR